MSTRNSVIGPGCQHGVDIKAFKGKDAREAVAKYEATIAEMLELAGATKGVSGRVFVLEVHRRAATCQTSLRWRISYGGWRHAKWGDQEMVALLGQMALDWRDFYTQANAQAVRLNKAEMSLRQQLREFVA